MVLQGFDVFAEQGRFWGKMVGVRPYPPKRTGTCPRMDASQLLQDIDTASSGTAYLAMKTSSMITAIGSGKVVSDRP